MAYSPSSICGPSRASIFLGRHVGVSSIRGNVPDNQLPKNSSFVVRLQRAGYRTGYFGKYGIGNDPQDQGFDVFVGQLYHMEAHVAFPRFISRYPGVPKWLIQASKYRSPSRKIKFNGANCARRANPECIYVNDVVRDQVFAFIRESSKQPFFAVWAPTYPHMAKYNVQDPWTFPNAAVKRFSRPPERGLNKALRGHAAQVEAHLDSDIGRFLDLLESDPHLDSNTLVVFATDNGPHNEGRGHDVNFFKSSGGLRGFKRAMFEGGLRSPSMVRWKGVLPQGGVSNVPFALYDLAPTFLEAAGVRLPKSTVRSSNGQLYESGSMSMLRTWIAASLNAGLDEVLPRERQWLHFEHCAELMKVKDLKKCAWATISLADWESQRRMWKLVVLPDGTTHLFDIVSNPTEDPQVRLDPSLYAEKLKELVQLSNRIRIKP